MKTSGFRVKHGMTAGGFSVNSVFSVAEGFISVLTYPYAANATKKSGHAAAQGRGIQLSVDGQSFHGRCHFLGQYQFQHAVSVMGFGMLFVDFAGE